MGVKKKKGCELHHTKKKVAGRSALGEAPDKTKMRGNDPHRKERGKWGQGRSEGVSEQQDECQGGEKKINT